MQQGITVHPASNGWIVYIDAASTKENPCNRKVLVAESQEKLLSIVTEHTKPKSED